MSEICLTLLSIPVSAAGGGIYMYFTGAMNFKESWQLLGPSQGGKQAAAELLLHADAEDLPFCLAFYSQRGK